MKKTIKQLLEWLTQSKSVDPRKNETAIMDLYFYSNFHPLTTKQAIAVKLNSDIAFNKEIALRELEYNEGLKSIDSYKKTKKERLMEIVHDPAFDEQLKNLNVNFEIVKPQ